MNTALPAILSTVAFVVLAPVIGGILAGADRILTARMQARVGPPILQPFYDFGKLMRKQPMVVNRFQSYYLGGFLLFTIVAGCLFFSGGDLLLSIFALTVGGILLVVAAFSTNSPYSNIGAERELLQMMAYEPMLLITALGMYQVTGSFQVADILASPKTLLYYLPGVFFGFMFILTIKLRKSPFDLATSHHGHQELVKGLTTDFAGPDLALVEIAHWYENVLLLGFAYLFFASFGPAIAVPAALVTYFMEVVVDNTNARLTWQFMVKSSWAVTAVLGAGNLLLVEHFLR